MLCDPVGKKPARRCQLRAMRTTQLYWNVAERDRLLQQLNAEREIREAGLPHDPHPGAGGAGRGEEGDVYGEVHVVIEDEGMEG